MSLETLENSLGNFGGGGFSAEVWGTVLSLQEDGVHRSVDTGGSLDVVERREQERSGPGVSGYHVGRVRLA